MRWLLALLLCGFLALASAMAQQSPRSLAMQVTEPTPPSGPARNFCPLEQEIPFADDAPFDPLGEEVGAAEAVDVEQVAVAALATPPADGTPTPTAKPYKGKLRVNFITLAPNECMLGSHFYPAAIVAVMSGQVDILVELGPDAPAGAPMPVATVKYRDGSTEVKDLIDDVSGEPVEFVEFDVSEDGWVSIVNRSIVGFKNNGPGYTQILVAGLHPAAPGGGGNCGNGCRNRG